jgi:hypothetical protein
LIATTNEQMERLFSMFRQQVNPERVIATLEFRSAKLVWVHTGAEPVALWPLMASTRHWAMTIWITHGISSQTHGLNTTRNKEMH